jgi:transcriptional regulator
MYVPAQNRMEQRAELLAFMRQYSFATLATVGPAGALQATHLPLLASGGDDGIRLLGHLARANPQWQDLAAAGELLAVFQGPHAYISPSLYQRHPGVPTWNYAAVHAHGRARILESDGDKLQVLRELAAAYDPAYLAQMEELPQEFLVLKLRGIVAFEIAVTRLEARWKLSQERTPQERQTIVEALRRSGDSAVIALAQMTAAMEPAR